MILPIVRVLLLSSILGGFAVSASFAQGAQGGQGGQGQGQGGQMQGGGGQQGGAGGGQIIPPPGTGKQQSVTKQKQTEGGQQGQGGGQAMERKRHRGQEGQGEQAGRREGGREEMARGDHERRHRRDARFRYYHGGFWYAEPWWTGVVIGGNDRHVRWCRRHYPTYRVSSNTYITPYGRRRVCISPFS